MGVNGKPGGMWMVMAPVPAVMLEFVTTTPAAEPPVALVDVNADKHGTRKPAEAFLNYLYTQEAQEIEARNYYRPRSPQVLAKYRKLFPDISLATVDADFGGWTKAQATHFADGGVFDQIYQPGK
jgi:sulfate transport system substrate-binding protein